MQVGADISEAVEATCRGRAWPSLQFCSSVHQPMNVVVLSPSPYYFLILNTTLLSWDLVFLMDCEQSLPGGNGEEKVQQQEMAP